MAVVLVDAQHGLQRQTRRHARIARSSASKHVVAAVNKIDLVISGERFAAVKADLDELALQVGIDEITAIPVAARRGDNVVHRSPSTSWYTGPTLLEFLESIELSAPVAAGPELRLPVQYASRPSAAHRRVYSGRVVAGTIAVGDEIAVLPSGSRSIVTAPTRSTPRARQALRDCRCRCNSPTTSMWVAVT